MSTTRKRLLWLLLFLVLLPWLAMLFGMVGQVEMAVWLLLLCAWAVTFFVVSFREGSRKSNTV